MAGSSPASISLSRSATARSTVSLRRRPVRRGSPSGSGRIHFATAFTTDLVEDGASVSHITGSYPQCAAAETSQYFRQYRYLTLPLPAAWPRHVKAFGLCLGAFGALQRIFLLNAGEAHGGDGRLQPLRCGTTQIASIPPLPSPRALK